MKSWISAQFDIQIQISKDYLNCVKEEGKKNILIVFSVFRLIKVYPGLNRYFPTPASTFSRHRDVDSSVTGGNKKSCLLLFATCSKGRVVRVKRETIRPFITVSVNEVYHYGYVVR